ncbi:MAG: MFS transporter [Christensenellales bacterium]
MKKLSDRLGRRNPLLRTFLTLEGNQRACVWTEPMFGIPVNLYAPLVAVYMAALKLSPLDIGIVTTVSFISQMLAAPLGGVLTDKLGRRLCTLVFDFVSWVIPSFLWATAQGPVSFYVAALFAGAWRITETSWGLQLIEDAPPDKLIHLYAITNIAGLIAGFISPLTFLLVREFSLIATMRGLYGFMCLMMILKTIILYRMTYETAIGLERMGEVRGKSILSRVLDSRHVLRGMLHSKPIMLTIALGTCFMLIKSINDNFWPLLITAKLGIPEENLSLFSTLRTLVMLLCYLVLVPRLDLRTFRKPMIIAAALIALVDTMLFFLTQGVYPLIILGVLMEALALSALQPLISTLNMQAMAGQERARMLGLATTVSLLVSSPFGTIAGALAKMDRSLPMLLNIGLALLSCFIIIRLDRAMHGGPVVQPLERA